MRSAFPQVDFQVAVQAYLQVAVQTDRSPGVSASRLPGGSTPIKDKNMSLSKKKEALFKYELYAPNSCTVLTS